MTFLQWLETTPVKTLEAAYKAGKKSITTDAKEMALDEIIRNSGCGWSRAIARVALGQ